MIPIFLAPGIVSHNFQSGKMHLSVILSHLCGVRHLGRAKIKIPMFDLVWQVQYWCQFLYFVTPEIVSREWRIGIFGTSAVGTSVDTDSTRVLVAIPYSLTTLKYCQQW